MSSFLYNFAHELQKQKIKLIDEVYSKKNSFPLSFIVMLR